MSVKLIRVIFSKYNLKINGGKVCFQLPDTMLWRWLFGFVDDIGQHILMHHEVHHF